MSKLPPPTTTAYDLPCNISTMTTVSDRLMSAFQHLGLSGYRIQKIYGLSGGVVSNWRKNLCQPRNDFIDRFCQDYHVSKVWLLTGDGSMTDPDVPDMKQQILDSIDKIKSATGVTNKDLAHVIGAYPTVISDLKAGKATARPEWIKSLEAEFGFILHDMDLKKEVWKLRQEMEEIKRKLLSL